MYVPKASLEEPVLSPYRVLDLTDDRGIIAGKILADLGADVIAVEPPGGSPARRVAPFYEDDPDPKKSLFWIAYAANKRSITLDISTADGQAIFRRLVRNAHFLIESFHPGYLAELGLDYSALEKENPALVMVSITAFGQDGPYADYKSTDIVTMALGGSIHLTGDPDRRPVRISWPQSWLVGAATAAVGALVAHHHRVRTGQGQHVDASCLQAVVARNIDRACLTWDLNRYNLKRMGSSRQIAVGSQRLNFECKDGYVNFYLPEGGIGVRNMGAMLQWMDAEGMGDGILRETDWEQVNFERIPDALRERMEEVIGRFFMAHTKQELAEEAIRRTINLFPVNDAKDMLEYPQLRGRSYFQQVDYPYLGASVTHLGPFVQSTDGFLGVRRPAPTIGQHNLEVYRGELGLTRQEVIGLKAAGVI